MVVDSKGKKNFGRSGLKSDQRVRQVTRSDLQQLTKRGHLCWPHLYECHTRNGILQKRTVMPKNKFDYLGGAATDVETFVNFIN